jgi:hypothetical protein
MQVNWSIATRTHNYGRRLRRRCLWSGHLHVRRHKGEYLANWLVHLEPDGERLLGYLKRRTQWDS